MKYYNNYLKNFAQTPNSLYRGVIQARVNREWENNTLLYDKDGNKVIIEQELNRGTLNFVEIEAQRSTVTQFITNGIKNAKDYKQILFKNCKLNVERGSFFKFENNYWITYEPTEDETAYNGILVRRCNNTAKWVDPYTGEINETPCVLGEYASSPSPQVDNTTIIPNNHLTLWLQGNEKTIHIKENDRFIFNGRPFKVAGFNNFMQTDYVTKDTPMLFFDVYLDVKEPSDDLINNIANRFDYIYDINIINPPVEVQQNDTGQLIAEVKYKNEIVERPVVWKSNNEFALINEDGYYQILGENGDIVSFTASIGGKSIDILIPIKDKVVNNTTKIIISPDFNEVRQFQSKIFEAYLYINGVKQQDVEIKYEINGQQGTYSFVKTEFNTFKLTNNQMTRVPVQIKFYTNDTILNKEIKLLSMF